MLFKWLLLKNALTEGGPNFPCFLKEIDNIWYVHQSTIRSNYALLNHCIAASGILGVDYWPKQPWPVPDGLCSYMTPVTSKLCSCCSYSSARSVSEVLQEMCDCLENYSLHAFSDICARLLRYQQTYMDVTLLSDNVRLEFSMITFFIETNWVATFTCLLILFQVKRVSNLANEQLQWTTSLLDESKLPFLSIQWLILALFSWKSIQNVYSLWRTVDTE